MQNELLNTMKHRRSIRKYTDEQIEPEVLNQIIEAGLSAPNAGGGQRSMIAVVRNPKEIERIGRLNVACMHRDRLAGSHVSAEQPSIIDDPSIKSGFYGATALLAIFAQKNFLYSIPDAFCVAENIVIMAASLGVGSCIIARGEETFTSAEGIEILNRWEIPDNMIARCFVALGYCRGEYPKPKSIRPGRVVFTDR